MRTLRLLLLAIAPLQLPLNASYGTSRTLAGIVYGGAGQGVERRSSWVGRGRDRLRVFLLNHDDTISADLWAASVENDAYGVVERVLFERVDPALLRITLSSGEAFAFQG